MDVLNLNESFYLRNDCTAEGWHFISYNMQVEKVPNCIGGDGELYKLNVYSMCDIAFALYAYKKGLQRRLYIIAKEYEGIFIHDFYSNSVNFHKDKYMNIIFRRLFDLASEQIELSNEEANELWPKIDFLTTICSDYTVNPKVFQHLIEHSDLCDEIECVPIDEPNFAPIEEPVEIIIEEIEDILF